MPKPVQAKSSYIPAKIKQYVINKTNGFCAHPSCNKSATEFHHTNRFSLHNEHDPDKIVPLCKAHHQIAHLGLIENEDKQPYAWSLREDPDPTEHKYQIDRKVQAYMTG